MESGASARAPAPPDILDKRLNKDDVTQIAGKLVDVHAKSDLFGRILKVPKGTVESISLRDNKDVNCLVQVISDFVNEVEPKPTWRVILEALRNPLLREFSLAREIELSLTGTAPSNAPPPEMEPLRMASIAAAGSSSTSQMATPSPPKQMGFQWLPSMHHPQDSFLTSRPSHTVAASGRSFFLPNVQQKHAPLLSTAQRSPEASAGAIRATLPIKASYSPQSLRQRRHPPGAVAPTSVSSTTLSLTPFSGTPLPQSYMYNLTELKLNRDALENQFAELRKKVITLLQQRQIELDVVVNTLTALPASEQAEHESFFDKHLEELERCTKYRPLFSRLNGHWNYLSPQLLYHLVSQFLKTTDAKAKMDSYDRYLVFFRKQTLLRLFCELDTQYMEPVERFSKIMVKFEKIIPKDPTLQDVEDFRIKFARHYRLRDFALMLIAKATFGSFIVSFMVPNSVLERLRKDVPTEVLKKFGITQLNVGGLSVYPNLMEVTTILRSTEIALGSSTPYPLRFTSKDPPGQGQEAVVPGYVHAKNVDFTEKFEHLKKITLQSCELEQVSVLRLAELIKTLPAYKTNQELQFLSDAFDDLELRNYHLEVFAAINFHWKYYLWHKLLDVVVEKLNLKAPKEELHAFKSSLHAFFNEVRLLDFIKSEERKRVRPPNFSELVADFDWPEDALLNMVEQFQEQYLDAYDLQHYIMVLASAQHLDHFTITWFIPDVLTKVLKASLPYALLEQFSVFSLTISGDSLYINHKSEQEGPLPKDRKSFDRTSRRRVATCVLTLGTHAQRGEVSSAADKKEATAPETNREYSYLEAPPHDYFCPVTLSLLLEPHQTICCGKHLSEEAAAKITEEGGPCPMCKKENLSTTHDKHVQRQVQQLMVFCPHRNKGCGFMANITEIERHISRCPQREEYYLKDWKEGTEILSVQNASLIREELHPAQRKSYELSLALNVQGLAVASSPEEQLSQVVDKYLSQPAPTWRAIVKALQSPHVKCDGLAKKLEDKFCSEPPNGPTEEQPKKLDVFNEKEEVDFRLPHSVVKPTGVILGRGSFGEVVEVEYGGKKYAAKKLHAKESSENFSREIEIMTRVKHYNIVRYYGLCRLAPTQELVIVMQKVDETLSNILKPEQNTTLSTRLQILLDVVRGLCYLHNQIPAIIHRDLTANNVLVDGENIAKICDFGNSRAVSLKEKIEPLTSNPGTIDYMAPEALDGGDYNEKVDIFAFGHLSIHVIIQHRPYPLLRPTYRVVGKLIARSEVERRMNYLGEMKHCLKEMSQLYHIITKCLQDVPDERPRCEELMPVFASKPKGIEYFPPHTFVHPTGALLGQGVYSDVVEVEYKGKIYAAKIYRESPMLSATMFGREHEIRARIRHPNIVPYYGTCKLATDKSTVIVMERMDMNLATFLRQEAHISLQRKTEVLSDVARGLHYLHSQSPAIIHRDLSAGNVFFASSGTAKISDFGNSRMIDLMATPELLTSNPGTLDYMPPEALEGGKYDVSLDMFSFGHLSIHVLLQRRPHPLLRPIYREAGKLVARTEVERRECYLTEMMSILGGGDSHPLYQLIIHCLHDEPEARPSSADVLHQIQLTT